MRVLNKIILFCFLFISASLPHAAPQFVWYSNAPKQVKIHVDVFLSSTCPHCHKADEFFKKLEKERPWIVVNRYFINQDKSALQNFYKHLQQQNSTNFSVPAVFFCDSRWAGFADMKSTGQVLLRALNYCRQQISQRGELSQGTINLLRQWGAANQFEIDVNVSKTPIQFIITSALMDAFSPCSLFSFAAFWAFLWLCPKSSIRRLGIGLVFILSLGSIHYFSQAHFAYFYPFLSWLRLPVFLAGILLWIFILRYWWRHKLKEVKPNVGIYGLVILTALSVQVFQQTCALNIALIFEQWLAKQVLTPAKFFAYHVLYQIIYTLPLLVFLLFYLLLGRYRRFTRYEKILQISACFILATIGAILIIYPKLLASFTLSVGVIIAAFLFGRLYVGKHDRQGNV
ncbi:MULTISPECIES: thioredoxin domain-containing protein [Legionella]|uniref:Thioredoxin domain-containing protein n=1 Tax=Legionella septentrionalis TaxID=2498109 RepID=A0A3S0XTN5_9GAMM|nr:MULTISPECIES: hypothetical protein [Legionella]MCP0914330.1 hypothetical protein [Legionella sp. 27cVA30]RUQ89008.1 hypothetical protein EKM59_04220 [Legionella septentrionalis]RUR00315.1 hypothetical protein ELY11_02925 [Legionella septentrionalis]RUR11828.1 hypothetical protein ELY14_00870 [Legionella septentrionalis]RUR17515.1 hypothetical protein ELY10_00865 [Legionella septentrionalis]